MLAEWIRQFDWNGLIQALLTAVCALLCITIHELSHGWMAYRLGDPTAKAAGRLTLDPIKHIDPFGLILMVVAHVGWAKPVPVDIRYFKKPRRDMALTALAGPASNFVLAFITVGLCSAVYHATVAILTSSALDAETVARASLTILNVLSTIAILSTGLGVFNLIPISPLDGSKILISFLPEKLYFTVLRYERYVMLLVIVLVLLGVFTKPLSFLITGILKIFCALTLCPVGIF